MNPKPTLPSVRVAVVGQARDDTSYLLKQLQNWSEHRPITPKHEPPAAAAWPDGGLQIVNDFGPSLGAPRKWSIDTRKRTYRLWECVAGFQSLLAAGRQSFDCAIVVLSAAESVVPSSREFLHILRLFNCKQVIVYVADAQAVTERAMLDLVEIEAREALETLGFDGDLCAVLYENEADAQAQAQVLTELVDALDQVTLADELGPQPFVFSVSDSFVIRQRGTVCTGIVHSGSTSINASLQLSGPNTQRLCEVSGFEFPRYARDTEFDPLTLLLKGLDGYVPMQGELLTDPGAAVLALTLRVKMLVFSRLAATQPFVQYGMTQPFRMGLGSYQVPCTPAVVEDECDDNGLASVMVTLAQRAPVLRALTHRIVTESNTTVGIGFVTEVLE